MSEPLPPLADQVKALPDVPGVYAFYDAADDLLYVGKSVKLRTRVRSYMRPNGGHSYRTERLKAEATRIETVVCGSELEALLLESRWIRHRAPPYHIMGRTTRHYPFIKLTAGPFPRVEVTRELLDDGGVYFGPIAVKGMAEEALDALRPHYRWRSCHALPSRACLDANIGRCNAPCVGGVDAAGYGASMTELATFLAGDGQGILERLEADMAASAEDLNYERAAVLRNRLAVLRPLLRRQSILNAAIAELDGLVVLPAATPGRSLWLVVRRGRLVHEEHDVAPGNARGLARRLARVLAEPAPSLVVRQEELHELNIMAAWLYRHRETGASISFAGRSLSEAIADGMARARTFSASPARAVAERVAETRQRGPKKPS